MSNAANHHKIHYIEFATADIAHSRQFYGSVFGWSFEDWGPEYVSFSADSAGINGGFRLSTPGGSPGADTPLVVLYSADLKRTEEEILAAGGNIRVPAFAFPGGRRFHFDDGAGNVLAVWSE
jgi:hypothetical protein